MFIRPIRSPVGRADVNVKALSRTFLCSIENMISIYFLSVTSCEPPVSILLYKWVISCLIFFIFDIDDKNTCSNMISLCWVVVVAQLVEWSAVRISSQQKTILNVYCQLYLKDKNKEKEAQNGPF